MACTSPGKTVKLIPRRISFSPAFACRSLISRIGLFDKLLSPAWLTLSAHAGRQAPAALSNASFQADAQQLLRFYRKLHRQLAKNFFAEPVHNHSHRVLG